MLAVLGLAATADAATTVYNFTGTGGTNASSFIASDGETANTTASLGGRTAVRHCAGRNAQRIFYVRGTDATITGYLSSGSNLQPVAISVDGGAFTLVPSMTLTTWTTITAFTGLTDDWHTVIVRDQGTTSGLQFFYDADTTISVTGASPSIAAVPNLDGQYKVRASGVDAYVVPEGGLANSVNQGNKCKTVARPDGSFHFKGTISTLSAWVFRDGKQCALWIDGVQQSTVTFPTGSDWGRVTIASGLDSSAEHDYILQFGDASLILHDLVTTGGTGVNTTALAARDHDAYYGDSITQGQSGVEGNSCATYAFKTAMLRGRACYNMGIGSTPIRNYGAGGAGCTTNAMETRTATVTGLSPAPLDVFVMGGVNDALGGCSSGTPPTTANFKTSYRAMLDALATGLPSAHIYAIPIRTTSGNSTVDSTTIPPFNTAIAEAVSEKADADVTVLNPSTTFSTLHPGAAENTTFATDLYAALDVTAPTLSSPSGTKTGTTTGTLAVTTNESYGTLYAVATTSSTPPSAAQVIAGQTNTGSAAPYSGSQSVSSTGQKTFNATGLAGGTTYYAYFVHRDAATPTPNTSSVASASSFTTDTPADVTPPTLSSPVAASTGTTTGTAAVTTNEGNGRGYLVVTLSSTPPSKAQVKAGQNDGGTAAAYADSQVVSGIGEVPYLLESLTEGTTYYAHFMHEDAAGNQSDVASSASFTTDAEPDPPPAGNPAPNKLSIGIGIGISSAEPRRERHALPPRRLTLNDLAS